MSRAKLINQALKLFREGKWGASIAKWDEVIPLLDGDDKATAYSNRGNAKDSMGDYKDAIADYNQALEINSQYAEVYYNRGNSKGHMGDHKGAIVDLNRAIDINPQLAKAYNNRGKAKHDMGDPHSAIADLNRAIDIDPQNAEAYNNRGNSKNSLGDYKGAIADIDRALNINPQYANAYNNRGNSKGHMGDHTGAIVDYDQALKIDPNHTTAIHNRGVAMALQVSEKRREEIEAKLQAQLRAQQEKFDRELQEQEQKRQEQQKQFDRQLQEQEQKRQEQLNREKEEREAGARIIYSSEYRYTLEEYERRAARRGKWVWFLSGALALAAIAVYGHIARLGIEAWQAAQSPMAMINFSALSLFPFILMGTLVLSPLVWVIRMLNRDKHKYWVLREDAVANINLLRIIETGHNKREDLWLQLFDHYDKRGSANLIADWNRADTGGNNFTIKPGGDD